jgi:hypothetical protein
VPQSTPIRDGSRDGYNIDPFFIDRVEVIYGSNALQGIGATGGVVNQVTVGAPATDGVSVRTLVQGTAQDGFGGEAMGGKAAGLVGYRAGAFDLTAGATFEMPLALLEYVTRRASGESEACVSLLAVLVRRRSFVPVRETTYSSEVVSRKVLKSTVEPVAVVCASFAACASILTGRQNRRSNSGGVLLDQAGRPSQFKAVSSTRRNSAATKKS